MNHCIGCHMQHAECEINTIYEAKENCPCNTCIVKVTCSESCNDWYMYVKEIIYNLYKDKFGDSDALKGHVENKIKRLEIIKRIALHPPMPNPCAWYK